MLHLTPSQSIHPSLQSKTHISLLQTCTTPQQLHQLHALTIKTATFHQISVSSRVLSLSTDPKIGNFDYAISVFDRIEQPNSFTWSTIIKCSVENHRPDDAIVLFCELLEESVVEPGSYVFPCVIKGCAQICAIEEGKQIHGLVLKTGFGSELYVRSSLVNLYCKCGEIGLARALFERLERKDLVSCNAMLGGYVKVGEITAAQRLFDEMPARDSFSWTVLIDGYSKCGKVEVAREIFDRMPSRSLVSWNAMINGFMKLGEFESAHELFNTMPRRNTVTWNVMVAGYECNGLYVEALEVFDFMLEGGEKPDNATVASALAAVSGLALLDKGRWIHSYMDMNGFMLGGMLGTSLIEMYSKCGSIENALTVFHSISKKKLEHWTAIIVGLGVHGMADYSLKLFTEMQRSGVKPNSITFIGLLNACSHAGLIKDGLWYFNLMKRDYGIEPAIEHYGCLVDLLCRAGHLEVAKSFIDDVPMKPNKVIWMSLLSGCKNHGNIEIGEYAAKHVMDMESGAIGCYVLLSNMYAATGQWDKVSTVREMMKGTGVRKEPGCSLIEHNGTIHEFVVGDMSHPQHEDIYAKLHEMQEKLKCNGHIPDTTQVLLCIKGEKEKESELATHSERLAIAFGLLNVEPGRPIRVIKNLRICNDCHSVTKLLSKIYNYEIIVRDNSRFHHFKNGSCSCMEYW
ncbi:hypothetical protein Syun_009629 [Stephania yunnanensis]|uniref:DYW domain-containing protein n=1 Tax=Stephania yunnanensis TaxID=152371 RepID=A0AAP0KHH8_9MAGN